MICVLYNQEKKLRTRIFFKERSANVQKTKNQSAVFQNLNNQSDGFWPINHICEKRDRMKTPNMKKKPTCSKCFSYVLFMMASNWVYYRLTELYFSGTEAAEPKKSSLLPLNMDQFEKILYIQKIILIHSVTTTTYYITSSVCLLRISAALCLAWKQKKNIRPNL